MTARPYVLALLIVALAYVAGPRPVFLFSEFTCPTGSVERPVGLLGGVSVCAPPGEIAPNPYVGGVPQREIGLYLTNLHVRLFDFDLEADNYLGFAVGVP